jgi:uncharacterized protein with GYD domain
MALYVSFFSYTAETWDKLRVNPPDRPAAIAAVAGKLGGSIVSMFYMLGPFDGMVITELPDACSAAALSTVATSTGAFRQMETSALLSAEELPRMLELSRAAGEGFPAPGAAV